jgi:hypothetical protein
MPGIIATIICDKLTNHSKWDSFKFSLYSLTLGMGCYVFLQALMYGYNAFSAITVSWENVQWSNLKIWNIALNGGNGLDALEICIAVTLSIPMAFFASWLINFKFFNKLARKLRVSSKFGDENLYSYYLNSQEIDWVYVRDKENGFTYQGRVVSHSETDTLQELVLSEVSVYGYENSELYYDVPTIYISREIGKLVIEAIPNEILGATNE